MVACMICAVASVEKLTETQPSVQPNHAKLKISVFFMKNEWNQFKIMHERTRETQVGQVSRACKLSNNPAYLSSTHVTQALRCVHINTEWHLR